MYKYKRVQRYKQLLRELGTHTVTPTYSREKFYMQSGINQGPERFHNRSVDSRSLYLVNLKRLACHRRTWSIDGTPRRQRSQLGGMRRGPKWPDVQGLPYWVFRLYGRAVQRVHFKERHARVGRPGALRAGADRGLRSQEVEAEDAGQDRSGK